MHAVPIRAGLAGCRYLPDRIAGPDGSTRLENMAPMTIVVITRSLQRILQRHPVLRVGHQYATPGDAGNPGRMSLDNGLHCNTLPSLHRLACFLSLTDVPPVWQSVVQRHYRSVAAMAAGHAATGWWAGLIPE
jgi:hypothetical protein